MRRKENTKSSLFTLMYVYVYPGKQNKEVSATLRE